jgi:hypothetical protein
VGERNGQVKLWENACLTYHVGDKVGPSGAQYSIAMREGGYVHVSDGRIAGWEDYPTPNADVYDKYGSLIEEGRAPEGLFGESYLFEDAVHHRPVVTDFEP